MLEDDDDEDEDEEEEKEEVEENEEEAAFPAAGTLSSLTSNVSVISSGVWLPRRM